MNKPKVTVMGDMGDSASVNTNSWTGGYYCPKCGMQGYGCHYDWCPELQPKSEPGYQTITYTFPSLSMIEISLERIATALEELVELKKKGRKR